MSEANHNPLFPIVPIKDTVLFPETMLPLAVGRPSSIAAVEAALSGDEKSLVIVAQRDRETDEPQESDLYPVGTRAVIKRMAQGKDLLELLLQGANRVRLKRFARTTPFLQGEIEHFPVVKVPGTEAEATRQEVQRHAARFFSLAQRDLGGSNFAQMFARLTDSMQLVNLLGMVLPLDLEQAQALLEAETDLEAMKLVHHHLLHETQVLEVRQKIASEARSELTKEQREYVLRQQMQAIQKELGEQHPEEAEIVELRERLETIELPEAARKEVQRQLGRLEQIPPVSPEHQVIRSHLDLIAELPWTTTTTDRLDLHHARQVLDEDHFNLEEVKDRIIEHLAVLKLNPEAKAPILCFVGPPGVGKPQPA